MSRVDLRAEPLLLRIEALSVSLPTRRGVVRAVDGVSFTLGRGKTLGIVGESGCGKSMLCRTLMGVFPQQAMTGPDALVAYKGRNLIGCPERAFAKIRALEIAMVFQDSLSSLNPVMTIGRQIAEPLVHHLHMTARTARLRAVELLRVVEVPDPEQRAEQYPHQLSGGMRQRAAIAMAIACEPALLIADEATTALDATVQKGILDLLGRLQIEREMAVILVTHDLNMAAERADDIAVMYAGRIVEKAPAGELFTGMRMPYTRALTDSIPRLDTPPHTPLRSIGGQPPDLIRPMQGCPFSPRCNTAQKRCFAAAPPFVSDTENPDHWYACWFPLERRTA